MTQKQMILNEVAKMVGVQGYKIAYAITTGQIPDSKLRIAGKRVFTSKEVEGIKKYFDGKAKKEAQNVPK